MMVAARLRCGRAAAGFAAFFALVLPACGQLPIGKEESFAIVTNHSEERPPLPDVVRVLTWNVRGHAVRTEADLDRLAEVIRESDADVVLLQEIHRRTPAAAGRDHFAELVERTELNGCFGKSLELGDDGAYGNAILSRAPLGSARRVRLPGRGETRTLLRCESQWDGIEVPLLTTHLVAWDRARSGPRRAQIAAIAERVTEGPSPLLILGGDFNASHLSPEMAALRERAPLRPVLGDRVATHRASGRSYDHLFVGAGWTVDEAAVLRAGASDHWPVAARLRPLGIQEPGG